MSLTVGKAPFGQHPGGSFDFEAPTHVVYVERFPRRVRGIRDGKTVIDSDAVVLVHETGRLPHYAFPRAEVEIDADDEPHAEGHVKVDWDAVDAWFEEDERVEVHPRDPYHRVDTFSTSRHVVVSIDGHVLADSTRAIALYETSLPVRYYLPPADVRMELLELSPTMTECPYKGAARHWSARVGERLVEDAAWQYDNGVRREAEAVTGLLSFYDDQVEIVVDGEPQR